MRQRFILKELQAPDEQLLLDTFYEYCVPVSLRRMDGEQRVDGLVCLDVSVASKHCNIQVGKLSRMQSITCTVNSQNSIHFHQNSKNSCVILKGDDVVQVSPIS